MIDSTVTNRAVRGTASDFWGVAMRQPGALGTRVGIAFAHRIFREALRELLAADPGISVTGEAEDGGRAIELARRQRPDVMIMDRWLPGLSAVEATRRLTAAPSQTRVLILPTHGPDDGMEEVVRAGASGYLSRHSSVEEVLGAIAALRRGEAYVSPDAAARLMAAVAHPSEEGGAGFGALSPREKEVLQLVAEGHSSKEIASRLGLSCRTVETHRSHLLAKLGARGTADLVRAAIRARLVPT